MQKDIATMFNVSQTTVSSIINGLSYTDAPWPISIASSQAHKSSPKFPDYKFDDQGNIYSYKINKRYGRKLKLQPSDKGYWMVAVVDEHGKQVLLRVNRIICKLFNGLPPTSLHQAMHLNGIKTDNRAVNLAWGTQTENEAAKEAHGTKNKGEKKFGAKLTEAKVKEIRSSDKSSRKLARQYGISQVVIVRVRNRKTWKHVQ